MKALLFGVLAAWIAVFSAIGAVTLVELAEVAAHDDCDDEEPCDCPDDCDDGCSCCPTAGARASALPLALPRLPEAVAHAATVTHPRSRAVSFDAGVVLERSHVPRSLRV